MTDGPVLLAGGNPRIPKGDGEAPVRAYLEAMAGWKHHTGMEIDAAVARLVPGVRKAVRWNTPFYGVEGNGWFLGFHCFDRYVKVSFLTGDLLDPMPPVGSKVAGTRYLHLHEGDAVATDAFASWVVQAAVLPGVDLF